MRSGGCKSSWPKSRSCESSKVLDLKPFLANRIKLLYSRPVQEWPLSKQTLRKDMLLHFQVQKRTAFFTLHPSNFHSYITAMCLHSNEGHWQQSN